jgi:hypothetical protein
LSAPNAPKVGIAITDDDPNNPGPGHMFDDDASGENANYMYHGDDGDPKSRCTSLAAYCILHEHIFK